jgi:hypothetical protein
MSNSQVFQEPSPKALCRVGAHFANYFKSARNFPALGLLTSDGMAASKRQILLSKTQICRNDVFYLAAAATGWSWSLAHFCSNVPTPAVLEMQSCATLFS